ncbi:MAG: glycosyl-4,4'-diaponeurosporenoate acyltransferase, partial [Chloroflexi bacterium]|nr:glycosyl-4,4'-diaponeurosporenoate acyltransferase [Chloroflexota bacterium]
MRLLSLSTGWTIALDILAWLILQPAISWLAMRLPLSAFDPGAWLYRARPWERGGSLYQTLFRVRHWKERLP